MTRPANPSKKQPDVRTITFSAGVQTIMLPDGMEVDGDIKLKPIETPTQRTHRHKMEVRRFWVQEAPIHLTAIFIAVSGTGLALILAFRPNTNLADRQWSFGVLSHLLIAVAGFAFGKAAK